MISTGTFEPTVQKLNIIPAYMLVKRERRDSSCLINLECRYRKYPPSPSLRFLLWRSQWVLQRQFRAHWQPIRDCCASNKEILQNLVNSKYLPLFSVDKENDSTRLLGEKKHNPTRNHNLFKFISTQHLISCYRLGAKRHMACYQQQKQ